MRTYQLVMEHDSSESLELFDYAAFILMIHSSDYFVDNSFPKGTASAIGT